MRTYLIILLIFLFHFEIFRAHGQVTIPPEFQLDQITVSGDTIPYRLFVPNQPAPPGGFPLIVALHGLENFASPRERFLQVAGYYALGWLEPDLQAEYPSVVLAPHVYDSLWIPDKGFDNWSDSLCVRLLDTLIRHVQSTQQVDSNRMYLTGHSMGGIGTWMVPSLLPHRFAALMPLNTAGTCERVCPLLNRGVYDQTAVWAGHHEQDAATGLRPVFTQLDSLRNDLVITHAFGERQEYLTPDELTNRIAAHERSFYTEYTYRCGINTIGLSCHTSPMDTLLRDPYFRQWVFQQHLQTPGGISIRALREQADGGYTLRWETREGTKQVEAWIRGGETTDWKKLGTATNTEETLAIDRQTLTPNTLVRLLAINENGFVFARDQAFAHAIPKETQNPPASARAQLYPNPAYSRVFVGHLTGNQSGSYVITTLTGKVVHPSTHVSTSIDVGDLPAGPYVLIIRTPGQTHRLKFTVAAR